ncbi:MAG: hypothetical protein LUH10_03075 [Tannerellaceae bacterium]|nr:hypothetical protein [Tannerellaceae bacterium]
MRFRILLVFFIILYDITIAQDCKEYHLVLFRQVNHTLSYINLDTEEDEKEKRYGADTTKYRNIVGVFTNDSIYLYNDFTAAPRNRCELFVLSTNGNEARIYNETNALKFHFDKSDRMISVTTENDYPSIIGRYLYDSCFVFNNIHNLFGLFIPGVENLPYSYQSLIRYPWVKKDNNRILSAQLFSPSPHNDMITYQWKVTYDYSGGKLTNVIKAGDDIYNENTENFRMSYGGEKDNIEFYEIINSDEGSRYWQQINYYRHVSQFTDSLHITTNRLGYEETSSEVIFLRKEYTVSKLDLSREEIMILIQDDMQRHH